jgi:phage terminase large subunit-like protein
MSNPPSDQRDRVPILRTIARFPQRAVANWRQRHRLPFNFWIHMIGIPMAMAGLVLLFFEPWWGLAAIVVGYLLQYIGHRAEGNDLGEWAGIKRLFGFPCVAISPRWQQEK